MNASSEDYAIRFGGIWLEFHERIIFAESNLKLAEAQRDLVTEEKNAILVEKAQLEEKYKNSAASLTVAETGHLETRQIFDKIREEHHDLSRRCLAAEAQTEWLDDQLRQQKLARSVQEGNIEAQKYTIERLNSEVADLQTSLASTKNIVAKRETEIGTLINSIQSKSEELVVLTRSAHSKDKQIALLVRERNGLKEDLERTQRSLAIARRNESSVKHRAVAQELADRATSSAALPTASTVDASTSKSAVKGKACAVASLEITASPAVFTLSSSSSTSSAAAEAEADSSAQDTSSPRSTSTSAVGNTLRKYKACRTAAAAAHPGGRKTSFSPSCSTSSTSSRQQKQQKQQQSDLGSSVLLDDILDSVLDASAQDERSSNTLSNSTSTTPVAAAGATMAEDTDTVEAVAETLSAAFRTPQSTRRKQCGDLADGADDCVSAAVLLDDSDLQFIDSVLDSEGEGADGPIAASFSNSKRRTVSPSASQPTASSANSTSDLLDTQARSAPSVGGSVFDATVHKMLRGNLTPSARSSRVSMSMSMSSSAGTSSGSVNPWGVGGAVVTPDKRRSGGNRRAAPAICTPDTLTAGYSPSDSVGSETTTDDAGAAVRQGAGAGAVAKEVQVEVEGYRVRERDYQAALYLLQEEVRQLRAQVAQHDAMKRCIRQATPKGGASRKKIQATAGLSASAPQPPHQPQHVAQVGAVPVQNRSCARKLEFSALG